MGNLGWIAVNISENYCEVQVKKPEVWTQGRYKYTISRYILNTQKQVAISPNFNLLHWFRFCIFATQVLPRERRTRNHTNL